MVVPASTSRSSSSGTDHGPRTPHPMGKDTAMTRTRSIAVVRLAALSLGVTGCSAPRRRRAPPRSITRWSAATHHLGPRAAVPAAGAQAAVLLGNPAKEGPFVLRLKFPAGFIVPPHRHSKDEFVTVISGSSRRGPARRSTVRRASRCRRRASSTYRPACRTTPCRGGVGRADQRHRPLRRDLRRSEGRPAQEVEASTASARIFGATMPASETPRLSARRAPALGHSPGADRHERGVVGRRAPQRELDRVAHPNAVPPCRDHHTEARGPRR